MKLVDTEMEPPHLQRNREEFSKVQAIASGPDDHPVLMINLNRYRPGSGFPDGGVYKEYVSGLDGFIENAGGRILGRLPVFGQAVGDQRIDEIVFAWYPLHRVFTTLYEAPGAAENFRLKELCVEYAVIHRCPGDLFPVVPHGHDLSAIIKKAMR